MSDGIRIAPGYAQPNPEIAPLVGEEIEPCEDEIDCAGEDDPDIAVLKSGHRRTATIRSADGFVTVESDSRAEAVEYAQVAKRLFRGGESQDN